MKSIDLNCDVGEGMNNEAQLMPFLSSCSIACGLHAGDDDIMNEVISLAIKHNVTIGAHPSFDDRANFGRTEMNVSNEELDRLIREQVMKLKEKAEALGGKLRYVKPHGALYNMAARSSEMSEVIVNSLLAIDKDLRLMGLAGSAMQEASENRIGFIAEGFADRKYATSSSLKPRKDGGLVVDFEDISTQLRILLELSRIHTDEGWEPLSVQSLCLHGDTPGAPALIKRIHELIVSMGFEIKAP